MVQVHGMLWEGRADGSEGSRRGGATVPHCFTTIR